jgi:hypothetical protein
LGCAGLLKIVHVDGVIWRVDMRGSRESASWTASCSLPLLFGVGVVGDGTIVGPSRDGGAGRDVGGTTRGLGLLVDAGVVDPREAMRDLTLAIVRPTTVRDLMSFMF